MDCKEAQGSFRADEKVCYVDLLIVSWECLNKDVKMREKNCKEITRPISEFNQILREMIDNCNAI